MASALTGRGGRGRKADMRGRCCVEVEAEKGGTQPRVEEAWGAAEAGGGEEASSPEVSWAHTPLGTD